MAVLIGIDEAGYGPLLGPLVVSAATFKLPDEYLKEDMWSLLSDSVGIQKRLLKGRLLVTDSKKAYNRKNGLGHLQRTVLAFLKYLDYNPSHLADLANILSPEVVSRLGEYDWYQNLDKAEIEANQDDISIAASVLKKNSAAKNIHFHAVKSECLDVCYYNDLVERVKNKASVLFTAVCSHIHNAFEQFGDQNLQIVVDRQGGRTNYVPTLSKMFPDVDIRILREDKEDCSYLLSNGNRTMKIHFVVKADARFLPVALASMVSKYLRELMIEEINGYFIGKSSEIKATAGYWQDGLRFVGDVASCLPTYSYDEKRLVRSR